MPEPSAEPPLAGARVPKVSLQLPGLVVEYRNQPVVVAAPGLTEPFSVADEPVTLVALAVTVTGAPGTVKESTGPNAFPEAFATTAQK